MEFGFTDKEQELYEQLINAINQYVPVPQKISLIDKVDKLVSELLDTE